METVDTSSQEPKKIPGGIKIFSILTFIGSGIYFLLLGGLILSLESSPFQFVDALAGADMSTDEAMKTIKIWLAGMMLLCVLAIYGMVMMRKGKKAGYLFYAAGNFLWGAIWLWAVQSILSTGAQGAGPAVAFFGIQAIVPIIFALIVAGKVKHL